MTLREKAIDMFGNKYYEQCPSKLFGIVCLARNEFPDCGSDNCWKWHETDRIKYYEPHIGMLKQQIYEEFNESEGKE